MLLVRVWGRIGQVIGIRNLLSLGYGVTGIASLAAAGAAAAGAPLVCMTLICLAAFSATVIDGAGNVPFLRAVHHYERAAMTSVFMTFRQVGSLAHSGRPGRGAVGAAAVGRIRRRRPADAGHGRAVALPPAAPVARTQPSWRARGLPCRVLAVVFLHPRSLEMPVRANERVAWFNGEFMPESQVRIPFRDSSWVYGDGGFDMTRSFGHRLFKVKEHVDRLYRSLKYLRIDPGFGPEKMCALSEEVFERNRHLLGPDDDYWLGQRISRGVKKVEGDNIDYHGPNVVLECSPLPFVQRAKLFKEGIRVVDPLAPPRAAGFAHAARQDPQLPEPDRRQPGGEQRRSGGLGDPARRQRQPLRGHGLQHLHGARRRDPARRARSSCCRA